MRWLRRRWVQRGALVALLLLSTAAALAGVEWLGRLWLRGLRDPDGGPPAPSMLVVPFQPYLMFGDQYGWFEETERDAMLAREGPGAYGYAPAGGTYVYTFDRSVDDIADRGAFLFDDQPLAEEPAAAALRVFVIGASVARGVGASTPQQAWHALLQRRLQKALGREVRFVSAAVDAYVSTQERLVFRLMVLPRCPDAVLVLDGWNDAAMPGMFGTRPGDPVTQGLLYQRFYSPTGALMQLLGHYSALARYLAHQRMLEALDENRRHVLEDEDGLARYATDTASVYVDNVTHLLDACRRQRLPCAAFLQPARAVVQPVAAPDTAWGRQEALERAAYAAIRSRLADLPPQQRVHDLAGLLAEAPERFLDPVHFDDGGQEAVAEAMLPVVLESLGDDLRPAGTSRCTS